MLARAIAIILVPLGINLNWVFAPILWRRISRGASVSLEERQRAALHGRRLE